MSAPGGIEDIPINAFAELDNPFTFWEFLKFVVFLPLAILRVILLFLTVSTYRFILALACLGSSEDRPLAPWRRAIVYHMRFMCGIAMMLMGFFTRVHGRENLKAAREQGVKLVVFNHPSWVDTIVLNWLCAPSGVSRPANKKIFLIGGILTALRSIYVHRWRSSATTTPSNGGNGTAEPLLEPRTTTDIIKDRLVDDADWPMIAIAPEGMTHSGEQLLRFHTGAFVHGKPVLPVCISYRGCGVNPAWTMGNEIWHTLRLLAQPISFAQVMILPVHTPTPEEVADAKLFSGSVRIHMADALGLPLVDVGSTEYLKLAAAGITVGWRGNLVAKGYTLDEEGYLQPEGRLQV